MSIYAQNRALGGIGFRDIYNVDFNIDTLVVNGTNYSGQNIRLCLTNKGSYTWGGTFPTGLETSGAEVLTLANPMYGLQLFIAQDGFGFRVNFGGWRSWVVLKP